MMTIKGKLLWEPDFRYTESGTPLCSFTLECSDDINRSSLKPGDRIRCTAWGDLGCEIASQDHKPGMIVIVWGVFTDDTTWKDRNDVAHTYKNFTVKNIRTVDA